MKYKCIFFDLDHTLWDYETNSRDTLKELFERHKLKDKGINQFGEFHATFKQVNQELWFLYDHGKIDSAVIRKQRFRKIFEALDINDMELATLLSQEYIKESPKKGKLMPGAHDTLRHLAGAYPLTVVTNGFNDIQHIKLTSGELTQYFRHVVTSEKAGFKKPAREIFDFALAANGVSAGEAVMIGDNLLTDIAGAHNASVDAVFFNPGRVKHQATVTHEISSLNELCSFL
ncbi:YjjG family noncanonical pyrimidine nucleotidase [Oscillatoria amoena NRMC-F 0135]|nr:YjjG family noncanonical pyrimidine nucleotidase [Oscillatoria amoena NRMC-F 0135]